MIVINRHWLHLIGMSTAETSDLGENEELLLVGHHTLRLDLPDGDNPGTLLLVGVNNRAGLAKRCVAVIETCLAGDIGDKVRVPLQSEARTIFDALESVCHPTARAIEAALLRHMRDRQPGVAS